MLGKKDKEIAISTIVGKDSEIAGNFTGKGSARIDGKVDGDVTVEGALIMGAAAVINGNVTAASALIGGEVTGNIVAPQKTELTATAKVLGDIATAVIVIDEHAIFHGKCDMNQDAPSKKKKAKTTRAVRAGKKSAKAAIAEALKEVAEEAKREENEQATVKTFEAGEAVAATASATVAVSTEDSGAKEA